MSYGILNWRSCRKCGKKFDIATNRDICPECRKIKRGRKDGKKD